MEKIDRKLNLDTLKDEIITWIKNYCKNILRFCI